MYKLEKELTRIKNEFIIRLQTQIDFIKYKNKADNAKEIFLKDSSIKDSNSLEIPYGGWAQYCKHGSKIKYIIITQNPYKMPYNVEPDGYKLQKGDKYILWLAKLLSEDVKDRKTAKELYDTMHSNNKYYYNKVLIVNCVPHRSYSIQKDGEIELIPRCNLIIDDYIIWCISNLYNIINIIKPKEIFTIGVVSLSIMKFLGYKKCIELPHPARSKSKIFQEKVLKYISKR